MPFLKDSRRCPKILDTLTRYWNLLLLHQFCFAYVPAEYFFFNLFIENTRTTHLSLVFDWLYFKNLTCKLVQTYCFFQTNKQHPRCSCVHGGYSLFWITNPLLKGHGLFKRVWPFSSFKPLSVNRTNWSNTTKQLFGCVWTFCAVGT